MRSHSVPCYVFLINCNPTFTPMLKDFSPSKWTCLERLLKVTKIWTERIILLGQHLKLYRLILLLFAIYFLSRVWSFRFPIHHYAFPACYYVLETMTGTMSQIKHILP